MRSNKNIKTEKYAECAKFSHLFGGFLDNFGPRFQKVHTRSGSELEHDRLLFCCELEPLFVKEGTAPQTEIEIVLCAISKIINTFFEKKNMIETNCP